MTTTNPFDDTQADATSETAPNPRQDYKSPELLMAATELSDAEKRALLEQWRDDLNDRLNAEAEGMSASDPIKHHREAKLADEHSRVNAALIELSAGAEQT